MTFITRLLTRLLSSTRHARPNPRRPPPSKPPPPSTPISTRPRDPLAARTISIRALKLFCAYHLLIQVIGHITLTSGPSMLPTLSVNGDRVLFLTYYRRGRGVKVGDVVAFTHPVDPEQGTLKRVVGMPGDFVCTGEKVGEGKQGMIQVPKGHCWLLGDNLPESRDSRLYGPLPLALITAKGVARVWPLSEMGWLRNTLQAPDGE